MRLFRSKQPKEDIKSEDVGHLTNTSTTTAAIVSTSSSSNNNKQKNDTLPLTTTTTTTPSIDWTSTTGLRGFLALFICTGHFRVFFQIPQPPSLRFFYAGTPVLLFFLLSGLLHGSKSKIQETSTISFVRRKYKRLLPLHVTGWALGLVNVLYSQESCYVLKGTLGKVVDVLLAPFLLVTAAISNGPSWYAIVQVWCYVVTPYMLQRIHKLHHPKLLLLACWILPAILARRSILGIEIMYLPFGRVPHYVIGLVLGRQLRNGLVVALAAWHRYALDLMTIVYVGTAATTIVAPSVDVPWWLDKFNVSWEGLLPFLALYLVLLVTVPNSLSKQFFNAPPLRYLGTISYALYCVHVPLLRLVGYVKAGGYVDVLCKNRPGMGVPLDASDFWVVLPIVGVAHLCHYYIDDPLQKQWK